MIRTDQDRVRGAIGGIVRSIDSHPRWGQIAEPVLARTEESLARRPVARDALRGRWLGHSLHPVLTDFVEGAWASASFLDLFGPKGSERAARRLVGFGLATAVPTAVSGAADGAATEGSDRRLARAHAVSSSLVFLLYAASYLARRVGKRRSATALGLAGGLLGIADGYVAGHLGHVRRVGLEESLNEDSRYPAVSEREPGF